MIKTTAMLLHDYKTYSAPANKIARLVNEGSLVPIVRGLYETDRTTSGHLLAASIYGPSYISFDYALSHWQLIPEATYIYTCATFDKKKAKRYDTPFGIFTYRDVPKKAYPHGIKIVYEGEYIYYIATPEKALCDKLYTISPLSSQIEMESLLFEDLRMEREDVIALDHASLLEYAALYNTMNHRLLTKLIRRLK